MRGALEIWERTMVDRRGPFFWVCWLTLLASRRASSCVDSGKQGLDGFEAELESSARDRGQGRRKIRTSGLDQKGFFGQQKTRQ